MKRTSILLALFFSLGCGPPGSQSPTSCEEGSDVLRAEVNGELFLDCSPRIFINEKGGEDPHTDVSISAVLTEEDPDRTRGLFFNIIAEGELPASLENMLGPRDLGDGLFIEYLLTTPEEGELNIFEGEGVFEVTEVSKTHVKAIFDFILQGGGETYEIADGEVLATFELQEE